MIEETTRTSHKGAWAAVAVLGGMAILTVALVRAQRKEANRPESWLGKCDGALHELEERVHDLSGYLVRTA